MKTPEQIIEIIRSDSPCVFDIMNEQIQEWDKGNFPQSDSKYTWEEWYKDNPDIVPPTAQELLDTLSDYDGDNYDVHYWSGRYAQMKMDSIDTAMEVGKIMDKLIMGSIPAIVETVTKSMTDNLPVIRVPFTEDDADNIRTGGYFLWNFGGRKLFLFNTDKNPQWDPDAEEDYYPTAELPI